MLAAASEACMDIKYIQLSVSYSYYDMKLMWLWYFKKLKNIKEKLYSSEKAAHKMRCKYAHTSTVHERAMASEIIL